MSTHGPAYDGETGDTHRSRSSPAAELGGAPVGAGVDPDRETVPPDRESLLVEYLLAQLAALE